METIVRVAGDTSPSKTLHFQSSFKHPLRRNSFIWQCPQASHIPSVMSISWNIHGKNRGISTRYPWKQANTQKRQLYRKTPWGSPFLFPSGYVVPGGRADIINMGIPQKTKKGFSKNTVCTRLYPTPFPSGGYSPDYIGTPYHWRQTTKYVNGCQVNGLCSCETISPFFHKQENI